MTETAGWTQIDFEKDIEVGDRIGGGGVGIIYKGWFRDEPVALKVSIHPSHKFSFLIYKNNGITKINI
jgi:predicted Ser/Thr protein kinase